MLDDVHVGSYVGVVSYYDGAGHYEKLSLSPKAVAGVNDEAFGSLSLSGLLVSGRTLQVDTSNIQDIDGLGEFNIAGSIQQMELPDGD